MSTTTNQIQTFDLLNLSRGSTPSATDPLFLPVKAPTALGTAESYELVLMQPFTAYGIHWNGPDGAKRAQCQGEECPLCNEGHAPQPFYATVALDRLAPRYVIAQISGAVLQHLADAADAYVTWLCATGQARQVDVFDPAAVLQHQGIEDALRATLPSRGGTGEVGWTPRCPGPDQLRRVSPDAPRTTLDEFG